MADQEVTEASFLLIGQVFPEPDETELRIVDEQLEKLLIRGEYLLSNFRASRLGILPDFDCEITNRHHDRDRAEYLGNRRCLGPVHALLP